MDKRTTIIKLATEEREILEKRVRSQKTEYRDVVRAKIVLYAADGKTTRGIAKELSIVPAMVSKWRVRFAKSGLTGLKDNPRSGAPKKYDDSVKQKIFDKLSHAVPEGYSTWNGRLIAEALGVSDDYVWKVLRDNGICLQQNHSWCVSTDPSFAEKAAAVVGLYLNPPENAMVFCVDEKPGIQALERAQGWLKLPNGKAITGYSHEYKRHGTTTLIAALNIETGKIKAGHYERHRRIEFLDFMDKIVTEYPDDIELYVILDNLGTHKPKYDEWLEKHPNVHFHFTPTRASWLNQIEIWFSILWQGALRGASFNAVEQLRTAIDKFIDVYNEKAKPFVWTKQIAHPVPLKKCYTNL